MGKEAQRPSNNLPKVIQLLRAELVLKEVILSWEGRPPLPPRQGEELRRLPVTRVSESPSGDLDSSPSSAAY